jgi:purine-nucleoside phosphorylase
VAVGALRVLVALGRLHLYEGHSPATVAHAVRTAAAAGCRTVVLTNAAGALHREWPLGVPVLVSDHINLTGCSPLTGAPPPSGYPGRFADMSETYGPRLRAVVHGVAPDLNEGVYAGFHGPQFETPAEIRAAARLGADLCGMSTVIEAIAASHLGLDVLGLSLVTNLAAGLGERRLDVNDVVAVADASAPRLTDLLGRVVDAIAATMPS